jgi:DNA repair protein SbcD/Mre11
MKLRLLHAADLHLDSPLKGLRADASSVPPTFQAFSRLVEVALSEKVDAVLLAGDLYDKKDESIAARLHLRAQLQRLSDAKIFSFLVHGNHDYLDTFEFRQLPERAFLFGSAFEEFRVQTSRGPLRVQGISHSHPETSENLSRRFKRHSHEPTVGLLHANVSSTSGHAPYAPCSLDDLASAELDYWALGHVHTREVVTLSNGSIAAYPGNLQGRHINETGPRGALLVELELSGRAPAQIRFVECDVLRWHRCDVDVSQCDSAEATLDACQFAIEAAIKDSSVQQHALRVTLSGTQSAALKERMLSDLDDFADALRATLPARCQLESVRNESLPVVDVASLRSRGALLERLVEAFEKGPDADMAAHIEEEALKPIRQALKRARISVSEAQFEAMGRAGIREAFFALAKGESQ